MATNPALAELEFLVGAWDMELSDASFLPEPDAKVHAPITFEWIEEGAALVMRMGDAATPTATWIFGRDDLAPDYHVQYADDRGVSRVYRMSLGARTWRMWRDTPEFSQRFEAEVSADHHEISGSWRKSSDAGATWEHDFNVRYRRAGPAASPLRPDVAVTHILVVADPARSRDFWVDVLGATLYREYGGSSVVLRFADSWLLLVSGGAPTADKPTVTFVPPADADQVSHAMTLRVADCQAAYAALRARGVVFLTPPHDWGSEIRCFLRDPDGHLVEISESKSS